MSETILLRCAQDGEPLVTVTGPEMGAMIVCPICGAGGDYKEVVQHSAGLMAGRLSEKQLVSLREQMRLSRQQRT